MTESVGNVRGEDPIPEPTSMTKATANRLSEAFEQVDISVLRDLTDMIDEAEGPAPELAGSLGDQQRQLYGSINISKTTANRLKELLSDDATPTRHEFIEAGLSSAFREAKENENERTVPFGVRLSDTLVDPQEITSPTAYHISFCRTGWLPPRIDDTTNDDNGG